jgi:hypothetical protein
MPNTGMIHNLNPDFNVVCLQTIMEMIQRLAPEGSPLVALAQQGAELANLITAEKSTGDPVRIDGPRGEGWIGPFSKSKRNMKTTQPMQSYKGQFTANLLKQEGKTTLSKARHGKKHNKQRYKLQVWNAWMQRRGKETTGFFPWYR